MKFLSSTVQVPYLMHETFLCQLLSIDVTIILDEISTYNKIIRLEQDRILTK